MARISRMGRRLALGWALVGMLFGAPRLLRADVEYVEQAIQAGLAMAGKAHDMSGYGPHSASFCLLGGWISKGGSLTYQTTLQGGKTYLLIGGADTSVKDLDLKVETEDGSSELHDDATDATPLIEVTPKSTMTVNMHLFYADGNDPVCFAVLLILEDHSPKGSLDSLAHAGGKLVGLVQKLQESHPVKMDATLNRASVFACLLNQGESIGLSRGFPPSTSYAVVAVADPSCKDLDLRLSQGGKEVVADTDDNPVAVVEFETRAGEEESVLEVRMENAASTKPSFAIGAVLQKE
ncbi:MAG: hypothetical protein HYZ53_25265 [Planctomycetes bacterium]|nr:hypothetical protein [Planctomycetota bacterium]